MIAYNRIDDGGILKNVVALMVHPLTVCVSWECSI